MSSSGSPKSEAYNTRYSTPAPELDDHRQQATSLPRRDTTRKGSIDRPDFLRIHEKLKSEGSHSRDFEHAILDDGKSGHEYDGIHAGLRRDSSSPMVARRVHRPSRPHDRPNQSRDSSSTRSSSPPNSVDAFAAPGRRRERANTIDSHAPSIGPLSRIRSTSGGTQQRRPTIDNGSVIRTERHTADEGDEDVCFPPLDDPGKTYKIDYEELEEFVALNRFGPISPNARRHSWTSQKTSKTFSELKLPKAAADMPRIYAQSPSPHRNPDGVNLSNYASCEPALTEKIHGLESEVDEKCPPKSAPERFCFFSSEDPGTTHASELGGLVNGETTFRDLFEIGPEGGVWWLDVVNPTQDEINAISRAFRIHPLTTEDILTQESREKVELFPQYYFVCFRTFYQIDKSSEDFLEPVNVYIVVCREGVLSFSFADHPHATNVRKRIARLRDYVALGSDWICYAMIDDIVDSFAPVIRDAEHESEAIEDQVFVAREDDFTRLLQRIGEARKKVINMMRLLGGKADVIKGFAKRCNEQYSVTPRGDIGLYLGDIQDHVVTMMSNLNHIEKMLSRSHGNYLAQVQVEGLVRGNHANKLLAKFTLIATILVPLNLICGLFGMNVPVPGGSTESLAWFFGIVGVIATFVVGSVLIARRMRYI